MLAEAMLSNSEGSAYVCPTLQTRGGSWPFTRPRIHSPGKVCWQAAVLLVSGEQPPALCGRKRRDRDHPSVP